MSVYAAHLTRSLGAGGAPSIFELTAAEQLAGAAPPALRRLAEFLASLNPGKFNWLVKWYDEMYLLFNGVLQYHYIKHYAASFSENFYGLQRVPLSSPEFHDGFHLPPSVERRSLALLVLLPYLRGKLERMTDEYRLNEADGQVSKSWHDLTKKLVARAYTLLHFAYETLQLVQFLLYMSGRAHNFSPLLRLAGVTLRYAPEIAGDRDYTWTELWRGVRGGDFRSGTLTFHMVGTAILQGMEAGAFFIQFLRWWESRGSGGRSALPVPQPPARDEAVSRLRNVCPLCLQRWRIPTALPISGYVFCYKCISRHLKESGACPVTKYPAKEQNLIRMYLSD